MILKQEHEMQRILIKSISVVIKCKNIICISQPNRLVYFPEEKFNHLLRILSLRVLLGNITFENGTTLQVSFLKMYIF